MRKQLSNREINLRYLIRELAQTEFNGLSLLETPYNVLDDYPEWSKKPEAKDLESSKDIEIIDISGLSTYPRKNEKLPQNKYFVIHHTGTRGSAKLIVNELNKRNLGIQWVVDREGKIYQTLPLGSRGTHLRNSDIGPSDAGNDTAQGVEVIANNDKDITLKQAFSVLKLVKHLDFSPAQIFGHGEVNSHKMRDEGSFVKSFILNNFNKSFNEIEKRISDTAGSGTS